MPMQMLGVLVCTEIGQHPAGPVLGDDLLRDDFDDIDQFEKQIRVAFRKRQEGGDMFFRNDDDVDLVEGEGMVVS